MALNGFCMSEIINNRFNNEFEPTEFYLGQNYPNPFRERTSIKYCIPRKTRVTIKIYNPEGVEIKKLIDMEQNPGTYEVEFHPVTEHQKLESCEYYYCMEAGDYKCEKKMILKK